MRLLDLLTPFLFCIAVIAAPGQLGFDIGVVVEFASCNHLMHVESRRLECTLGTEELELTCRKPPAISLLTLLLLNRTAILFEYIQQPTQVVSLRNEPDVSFISDPASCEASRI
jgi:hypothetical protein